MQVPHARWRGAQGHQQALGAVQGDGRVEVHGVLRARVAHVTAALGNLSTRR